MYVIIRANNLKYLSYNARVLFSGVNAQILDRNDSMIVVRLPNNGKTGKVTIEDFGKNIEGPVFRYLDLYVVGNEPNAAGRIVSWHNGGALTYVTNGTTDAQARSITVDGSDVFIAGYDVPNGTIATPIYWKNTERHELEPGTRGYAVGIEVVSGEVFVSGNLVSPTTTTAVMWTATGKTILPCGPYGCQEARAIAVSGSTVAVGGMIKGPAGSLAAIWQNAVLNPIGESTPGYSTVEDIEISEGKIYAMGYTQGSGTYPTLTVWKDGEPLNFSDGSILDFVGDMAVVGSDVLICGYQDRVGTGGYRAKLWINQESYLLTHGNDGDFFVTGIAVVENNIIFCGYKDCCDSEPFFAVNNQLVFLSRNSNTKAVALFAR